MKERFIDWCISKQGIITIAVSAIALLLLLTLTLTGVFTWAQVGWVAYKIIEIGASIFYHLFIFIALYIFVPIWIVMGIYELFKFLFKKIRGLFVRKPKNKTEATI